MKSYSLTDTGRVRHRNEDYVFVSECPIGNLPNLFVVADGMGGQNAGERASSYAVEVLLQSIRKSREKNPVKILRRAMEHANDMVYKESITKESSHGMGTTMVAATLYKDTLYVTNVGDSRLYIIGNGIRQITHDHSLVEEMVRLGKLTREEGRNHPDRNIITRAIGAEETVTVDCFEEKTGIRDVILLCSDGLTNMVSNEQIQQIVKTEKSLQKTAESLVDTANRNGGRDNITVLLISRKGNEVK